MRGPELRWMLAGLVGLVPRWLWRSGFWALVLAVGVLSLLPLAYLPEQAATVWDKAQHAIGFAVLAVLGLWAYPSRAWLVLPGLLLFGALIELAQAATGWRHGDWQDVLANAVGLALGALPGFMGRRPTTSSR